MKRHFARAYAGLVLLGGLAVMTACGSAAEAEEEESKPLVKTTTVQLEKVEQIATFAGNIEPFEKAYIASAQPVRIGRILKEVGDYVRAGEDRKSTRLNSSHVRISYAVFCLKKKKK